MGKARERKCVRVGEREREQNMREKHTHRKRVKEKNEKLGYLFETLVLPTLTFPRFETILFLGHTK